jgi:hypothetical protein
MKRSNRKAFTGGDAKQLIAIARLNASPSDESDNHHDDNDHQDDMN